MLAVTYRKTADLIPYINNSRTHSEAQTLQIASSIKEFGFTNPVLVDSDGGIIAGHGRLLAARKLGMDEVPTIELSGLSEAQKKAYIIADNKLALNAGWDETLLKLELQELTDLDFSLDLLGFDADELVLLLDEETTQTEGNSIYNDKYTAKTDVFTYEPTGDKPEISALFSNKKTNELLDRIEKASISEEIKPFLRLGAYRHIVFNFEQIANYYAHSSAEVQQLMEDSAMIIIDYEDAISGGFVQLTKELQSLVDDYD